MAGSPSAVRRSVVRYLTLSLLVLVMLGVVIYAVGSRLALEEAPRDARVRTRMMASALAAPLINGSLRAGDRAARARLGRLLEHRMRDGSVSHIVVFAADGTVLWSDIDQIRNRTVGLEPDVQALVGTSGTIIHEPGEHEQHSWSEPGTDELIEVYAGARDADGEPFVYEAYLSPDLVDHDRGVILRALLPYMAGAVLLFLLATLPLAVNLARRVDRAAAARSRLLEESLNALQRDRRRVAQHLHDGVVQDLSAAGYALTMLADPGPGADPPDERTRDIARRLADLVQDDLHQLRSLLTDLVPAQLTDDDLVSALGALQARTSHRFGLDVQLDVSGAEELEASAAGVVFEVAREGLANVGRHAGATRATVAVRRHDDDVVVTVTDNGVGLTGRANGAALDGTDCHEHLGLRLLARRLQDVGGRLELADADGGGARLTATIPAGRGPTG